jgi:hypothetical protein
VEGVPQVGLDGRLGDEQVLGDLAVGASLGGQVRDLTFGAGQRVGAGDRGAAGARAGGDELGARVLAQLGGAAPLGEVHRLAERCLRVRATTRPTAVRA